MKDQSDCGAGQQDAVKTVQNTAMSRDQLAEILDLDEALDRRREQISDLTQDRAKQAYAAGQDQHHSNG